MEAFIVLAISLGVVVGVYDLTREGPTDLLKLIAHECVAFVIAGFLSLAVSRVRATPLPPHEPLISEVTSAEFAPIQHFRGYDIALPKCEWVSVQNDPSPVVVCDFAISREDGGEVHLSTHRDGLFARVADRIVQPASLRVAGIQRNPGWGRRLPLEASGRLSLRTSFSIADLRLADTLEVALALRSESHDTTLTFRPRIVIDGGIPSVQP